MSLDLNKISREAKERGEEIAVERYVKSDYEECPFCNVKGCIERFMEESTPYNVYCECGHCDAEWADITKVVGIIERGN